MYPISWMKISKFVEVYSSHGLRLGIDSRSAGQRAIYFKFHKVKFSTTCNKSSFTNGVLIMVTLVGTVVQND